MKTRYERIAAAADKLASSRGVCALIALAFSAVLFCVASLAWIPNGVYDDWSISNALSGNWGQDEGLCLFLNALLCQLIFWLNTTFTSVNWFFALERICGFAAYFTLVYISLSRVRFPFSGIVVFAATVLVLPGCTYESNFTYVAGMLVAAGGMALLCSLASRHHSAGLVVAGLLLMCVGILFRWTMFLLCVPVFGVASLVMLFGLGDMGQTVGKRIVRLWPFAIALMCFAGLYFYNESAWDEQPWKEWYEFNEARSDIADYTYVSYEEVKDELSALGVSANDYKMLKSWTSEDPDYFTAQLVDSVKQVVTRQRSNANRVLLTVPAFAAEIVGSLRFDALLVALLAAACFCARGRPRVASLAIMAGTLVLCWALFAFGRMPARVFLPVWVYAAAAVSSLASMPALPTVSAAHAKKGAELSALGRFVGVCLGALPVVAIAFVLSFALPHLRLDRLEPLLDADSFAPQSAVMDYMGQHDENVYVLNISSNASLIYASLMIAPLDEATINRTTSVGGWAAHAPYATARNTRIGMPNPVKGLVENEHAYLLSSGSGSADLLLTYLREHYYPQATYSEVDAIDDPYSGSKMHVYKFSGGKRGEA